MATCDGGNTGSGQERASYPAGRLRLDAGRNLVLAEPQALPSCILRTSASSRNCNCMDKGRRCDLGLFANQGEGTLSFLSRCSLFLSPFFFFFSFYSSICFFFYPCEGHSISTLFGDCALPLALSSAASPRQTLNSTPPSCPMIRVVVARAGQRRSSGLASQTACRERAKTWWPTPRVRYENEQPCPGAETGSSRASDGESATLDKTA